MSMVRAEWLSDIRRLAAAGVAVDTEHGGEPNVKNERDQALEALINLSRGLAHLFETPENADPLNKIDNSADKAIATLHGTDAVPSTRAISSSADDRPPDDCALQSSDAGQSDS